MKSTASEMLMILAVLASVGIALVQLQKISIQGISLLQSEPLSRFGNEIKNLSWDMRPLGVYATPPTDCSSGYLNENHQYDNPKVCSDAQICSKTTENTYKDNLGYTCCIDGYVLFIWKRILLINQYTVPLL